MGCGDSGALTDEFSDLSLSQQGEDAVILQPAFSSSSQNTTTTVSSIDRCAIFDDDEDNENLTLELDNKDYVYDEYRTYNRQRSSDNEYELTNKPANTEVVVASLSTTSLSTAASCQRLNSTSMSHMLSYENWCSEKHREMQQRKYEQRESELRRRELEERKKREREEKERRDYDCFINWLERKKREESIKKELMEKELNLRKQIQDIEENAKVVKDMTLKKWYRKKEEQQKFLEKKELVKQKKAEEEKQRRFQDSTKAYEKWREKAKYAPRPATQGLLPHQKAKPVFTNPTPWQPLVNNASDESDTDNNHANQIKTSGAAIKSQRSKKASVKR
ncbi:coiled-coil domain-containing protein 34-like [Phymastichus coffea]|uniref:coiled-coil domain-containing protein 34-like n=1 Tax=Phymastichus coffea TaxID=108790 RepID=UPI00273C73FF|nr:coiled-coil domain-containing protein 34-like [Phymastichus coffea]